MKEGGPELAKELEDKGYEGIRQEVGLSAEEAGGRAGRRRGDGAVATERHGRRSTSSASARTSRSSTARSTGSRSCTWTRAATSQKPAPVIEASRRLLRAPQREHPPERPHAGRGGHGAVRGGPRQAGAVRRRAAIPRRSCSTGGRPRRSTSWRTAGGGSSCGRATRSALRARAPLEHHPVAAHGGGDGRGPAVRAGHRRRPARPRRRSVRCSDRTDEAGRDQRHVERARHHAAAPPHRRRRARGRRAGAGRRRAARAARAGRRRRCSTATS